MSIRLYLSASCVALAILSAQAGAAGIYRWVDEKGRTHVADTVPPRYKGSATKVDTRASELTERQRAEALARTAREKAAQAGAQSDSSPPAAPDSALAAPPPVKAGELLPSPGSRDECEALMRAYRESQECFAPFVRSRPADDRAGGGVREEAYRYCTSVPDPSPQCGIPSD